jgi:hypothetical protein
MLNRESELDKKRLKAILWTLPSIKYQINQEEASS